MNSSWDAQAVHYATVGRLQRVHDNLRWIRDGSTVAGGVLIVYLVLRAMTMLTWATWWLGLIVLAGGLLIVRRLATVAATRLRRRLELRALAHGLTELDLHYGRDLERFDAHAQTHRDPLQTIADWIVRRIA